jgi:hypothetical protein
VVDVAARDAGHRETRADRLTREPRDVLDPAEALFLGRGDDHAVAQQHG